MQDTTNARQAGGGQGDRSVVIPKYTLASGQEMRDVEVAFATYGRLDADASNAILLTHGYTSSHRFAEAGIGGTAAEGSWSALLGPGRAIDTDRYFVIAPNMLGGCYGSTGPASIRPETGRPWGPDFPEIALADIVGVQKRMLDSLGISRLVAVVGPSYGGIQGFQWAVDHPGMIAGLVAVVAAPWGPDEHAPRHDVEAAFRDDPAWNGGHYYPQQNMVPRLRAHRAAMLRHYGAAADLPEAEREAAIAARAEAWASGFDVNTLIVLQKAWESWDVVERLSAIRARVLYVLSRTDSTCPSSIAPRVMAMFEAAGVDARFVELDSPHGHLASGIDWQLWSEDLREFLARCHESLA